MNSQPSSASTRSIIFDGGGAPATTIAHAPAPGTASPRARRAAAASSTAATTAGAPARNVTPSRVDAPEDLLAVDLADDDLPRAHAR